MGRASSRKGTNLESRDYVRCCIALDFMVEHEISSKTLMDRYYNITNPSPVGDSKGETSQKEASLQIPNNALKKSSFHRSFSRDRKELEKEGLYLKERKDGSSKFWSVDEERSYANTGNLTENDRLVVARLLQIAMTNPELGSPHTLGACIAKIGQDGCVNQLQADDEKKNYNTETLKVLAEALQERKPIKISYKSLKERKASTRILQPWGMFSVGKDMYVVGPRETEGKQTAMRTYNLARIKNAKILQGEPSYSIAPDFSINDYRLLPFEIGDAKPINLTFYVDAAHVDEFTLNARKRGTITHKPDGSARWSGTMKDIDTAARWALEVGAIPLEPQSLIDAWVAINEEVIND